jgi:hypothetical protein
MVNKLTKVHNPATSETEDAKSDPIAVVSATANDVSYVYRWGGHVYEKCLRDPIFANYVNQIRLTSYNPTPTHTF